MHAHRQVTCWVVTSGVIGMENQCLGLAAALGLQPVVKRVKLRAPWKQLSPFLRRGLAHAFSAKGDAFAPPWPDLIIGAGRVGAAACLCARQQSGKNGTRKTFAVYIQNPVIDPSRFDLCVVPRHDNVLGENVITTRGSMHRVTPELLAAEGAKFLPRFSQMPSPLLSVIIGGNNAVYHLDPPHMKMIAAQLVQMAKDTGGSLLVTPSRRTGAENIAILKEALKDVPHMLWEGQGDNPYYGMLALGEALFVTADSVNMVSEACSTGKPVHIIPLVGGSEKFRLFHQTLRDDGMTRPFKGKLERWTYQPLNDVQLVAARVKEMMGL